MAEDVSGETPDTACETHALPKIERMSLNVMSKSNRPEFYRDGRGHLSTCEDFS
jgi:hypothetical protein